MNVMVNELLKYESDNKVISCVVGRYNHFESLTDVKQAISVKAIDLFYQH